MVEQKAKRGQPPPAWFLDCPDLNPAEEWLVRAFWELNSERQVGMGVGLIPWRAIIAYGQFHALDDDMMTALPHLIRAMDAEYVAVQSERREAEQARAKAATAPARSGAAATWGRS